VSETKRGVKLRDIFSAKGCSNPQGVHHGHENSRHKKLHIIDYRQPAWLREHKTVVYCQYIAKVMLR